jgi:FAD/FMN-containing dehydrogenase/Fe-S oxidoreductase
VFSPDQIQDDLRGEYRGRLHFDAPTRSLYASDASPFHVMPAGVAVPEDEADLQVLVKYAGSAGLPLVPRGAGTGLAGESLGPGLVLDLSRHFQGIRHSGENRVACGVGVRLADLNAALAPLGRRFAPEVASGRTSTVGGAVANNASGGNAFAHGYTRDHLAGVRVLWDDGELAVLDRSNLKLATAQLRTTEIRSQTAALLSANRELIQITRPHTPFSRCGYLLHDVATPTGLDLAGILAGSEGTLGIVTEAELRTVPLPGGRCAFALAFASQQEALRAGLTLRAAEGIVGCDLLDQRLLLLSKASIAEAGIAIPASLTSVLLVFFEADSEPKAQHWGRDAARKITGMFESTFVLEPASTPRGIAAVERFRAAAVQGMYALARKAKPLPFVEDTAVPGEQLVRYVSGVAEILRRADLPGSFLIHVLTAQVHVRPLVDLDSPADRERMWAVAEQVHSLAIGLGGTISGQHGTGLARTPWVEKQFGPLAKVFVELKRIFDPKNILNPGKIVGPDPSRPAWPLREIPEEPGVRHSLLLWPGEPASTEAGSCNGCGDCREVAPPIRMCPTFHASGDEAATPRAKANLFRRLETIPGETGEPEVRAIAETCVNCKMCRTECRSRVDIPKLALELKARYHAAHGLDRDQWVLARIETLMTLAGNFAFSTNRMLDNRPARWLIEKLFGISRKRTLHKFTHRTFLRRSRKEGRTRRRPKGERPRVAFFADVFVNFNDPLIGVAAVKVLEHCGYDVFVPPRQQGSGIAALVQGDVESAREIAAGNVRILAELIREGYEIVAAEPMALTMLTQDYTDLFDDGDTRLVAGNTRELGQFLWNLHEQGRLPLEFAAPLDAQVGHHVPCHIKALGARPAGPNLLGLIPGLKLFPIDKSCSGMAGGYGLTKANYLASLAAGKPMLDEMRRPRVMFGSTECGACRMQIQHATGKRTMHPVQYLALAYGLMPELGQRLMKPLGRLVTD